MLDFHVQGIGILILNGLPGLRRAFLLTRLAGVSACAINPKKYSLADLNFLYRGPTKAKVLPVKVGTVGSFRWDKYVPEKEAKSRRPQIQKLDDVASKR
jgi:hypothetical protein